VSASDIAHPAAQRPTMPSYAPPWHIAIGIGAFPRARIKACRKTNVGRIVLYISSNIGVGGARRCKQTVVCTLTHVFLLQWAHIVLFDHIVTQPTDPIGRFASGPSHSVTDTECAFWIRHVGRIMINIYRTWCHRLNRFVRRCAMNRRWCIL